MGTDHTHDEGALESRPEDLGQRPSRRSVVVGGGVAATAVWAAPTVLSVSAASAATFPPDGLRLFLSTGSDIGETFNEVDPLTAITTFVGTLATGYLGEALATSGGSLYRFTGNGISEITVAPFSQTTFVLFGTPLRAIGGAVADGTDFLVANDQSLFRVTAAGDVALLGSIGSTVKGLASVGGVLYTAARPGNSLFTLDPATGAVLTTTLTLEDGLTPPTATYSLTAHPTTGVLYLVYKTAPSGDAIRYLGTVDPATGVINRIGTVILPVRAGPLVWF